MNLRDRLQRIIDEGKKGEASGTGISEQDLMARLKHLERVHDGRAASPHRVSMSRRPPIEEILGGEIVDSPKGESILVKREYTGDYLHGSFLPFSACEIEENQFAILGRDQALSALEIDDLLFLDTETTGLSGGAGTCAFLVGAGFFRSGVLHIHQYFMRDYDEESAMLLHFCSLVEKMKGIVTYNGKSFDIPLLEERFILKRSMIRLRELPHIDLLFPSRRLFQGLFEDCRLVTLEDRILGFRRDDDIPGYLIPTSYFDFVRTGNPSLVEKVFSHNRMDILSLIALTARIASLLTDPFQATARELVKLGRFHHELGDKSLGNVCLESALKCDLSSSEKRSAVKHLSLQYKREGRFDEAAELWKLLIGENHLDDPFPSVELAKYYEHRKREPDKAMELVQKALSCLTPENHGLRESLQNRLNRLRRKIGSLSGSKSAEESIPD